MSFLRIIKNLIPKPIKRILRPIRNLFIDKYSSELSWWRERLMIDNGVFSNEHYQKIMLAMANEPDDSFLQGKIVADFGCGPRGSLQWIKSAAIKIGIDVLTDKYFELFSDNLLKHEMIYIKSTESLIPLPGDFIDVVYTVNAMDHVDDFGRMCQEIIRVLKPGGLLIGSFNLEEPPSPCEPQQLSENKIRKYLLDNMEIVSYKVAGKGPPEDGYAHCYETNPSYSSGEEGFLWVTARKKGV
jgi:SAM-dependent methyltransferase